MNEIKLYDESQENKATLNEKKPGTEEYIQYDSSYIKFRTMYM